MNIEGYAAVGDCRAAALVSRDGSCDWLCWPRFDSASIFGAIVDGEKGGRFAITPAAPFRSERRYLDETNVLEMRFSALGSELTLTDFMPALEEGHGMLMPEHEFLRVLHCERGEAEVEIVFDPRPDYARELPRIESLGRLGLRFTFSLGFTSQDAAVVPPPGARCLDVLERTARLWRRWARATKYDGPYRAAVVRSALILKMMQYVPSGAIVAAPTTSLPKRPGGDLNWDSASAGYATPRSPRARSSASVTTTKRTTSPASCSAPPPSRSPGCTCSTISTGGSRRPRGSFRTSPATPVPAPSASATPPSSRCSSTRTAR
jgi:hypothetical protein